MRQTRFAIWSQRRVLDIAIVSILQFPHTAAPEHPAMGYATIVFSTGTNLMIAYRAYNITRLALGVRQTTDIITFVSARPRSTRRRTEHIWSHQVGQGRIDIQYAGVHRGMPIPVPFLFVSMARPNQATLLWLRAVSTSTFPDGNHAFPCT